MSETHQQSEQHLDLPIIVLYGTHLLPLEYPIECPDDALYILEKLNIDGLL